MPRNAKTMLGWASLAPESRAPLPHLSPPPEAQTLLDLPRLPPVTIHPRRARRPRPPRPQLEPPPLAVPPAYRESPLAAPLLPLPPVLPAPAPQPALDDAAFDDAAPTLCDLPILAADTTAPIAIRARTFEKAHLHLLGAILLQIAGQLAHDDPELYVEGAIALYVSAALMLWCVIRILRKVRA